jgi:hypothetical protein
MNTSLSLSSLFSFTKMSPSESALALVIFLKNTVESWSRLAKNDTLSPLAYSSGRSAKEMRLVSNEPSIPSYPGPVLRPGARKLSDDTGLSGVRQPSLTTEGHGSLLDDPECMCIGLVNRYEMLAVAEDIPRIGAGKGV